MILLFHACIQLVPEIAYLCYNYSESHNAWNKEDSTHGKNNLSQEESEVPSSTEDIASSDQEID